MGAAPGSARPGSRSAGGARFGAASGNGAARSGRRPGTERLMAVSKLSRRALLGASAALLGRAAPDEKRPGRLKVCIFSKHLQFVQGEELVKTAAEIGFDGIDLTVRKG